ncbi:MAG: hypothetical protein ACTTKL_05330 [Treponema sp.]
MRSNIGSKSNNEPTFIDWKSPEQDEFRRARRQNAILRRSRG